MAKFTFTRDYMERQPGGKRHYKDWRAGETYVMTKEHATALQEQGYGFIPEMAAGDKETHSSTHERSGPVVRDLNE